MLTPARWKGRADNEEVDGPKPDSLAEIVGHDDRSCVRADLRLSDQHTGPHIVSWVSHRHRERLTNTCGRRHIRRRRYHVAIGIDQLGKNSCSLALTNQPR